MKINIGHYKYIHYRLREEHEIKHCVMLFSASAIHRDMARHAPRAICSAGFIRVWDDDFIMSDKGSESLNLKPQKDIVPHLKQADFVEEVYKDFNGTDVVCFTAIFNDFEVA